MVLALPTNAKCCKETKKRKYTFGFIDIVTFWVSSCSQAQYPTLRCVLFVSNVSNNFQLRQLRKLKFSKYKQLFPVLITLFRFYAMQLYSAEWIFLRSLWLKTLESSWLLGISQRILGRYASYSWSGDLGFLRLMQLFPLILIFSFPRC